MSNFFNILRKLPKIFIIVIITIFLITSVISSQLCLFIISFMSSYIENPIAECNQINSNISVINRYEILNERSVWLFCSFVALISNDVNVEVSKSYLSSIIHRFYSCTQNIYSIYSKLETNSLFDY